ncbi:conserved Plasmodium protein, unknown function [Plasmodium knowlesi strain H]|uniref:Secreted ookinete protein 25 n=3 Tax=Plasmodium knowlesi TaxID=5850 RepID=A0A5K1VA39_PLAKH|nr:secreted ookinete protein 25, putative [Plasmodium knowlesi strain H]OTN64540.1 Uncharacterized protein PKNOH_S130196800 [Plasmodium knowlesi]CAA9989128.1 secreted ookinete protein 25, putative [Plasmodium knowlesi strain H]SBO27345.1 conserved Plasmodium protein, unknown function [Plasmodium knowlesi strain H]SBO27540.1 conserved Plasmodium protein, unknown function [Plasmodium knowlesi strain H]VVS78602.1 secreted ookinete protein 25, putative [Plasmodium knowlesi strain H]|eukprot:XP_002261475.1 hypothetical protein, conserved in Plasmodium species [Plasmodium knowlesi strain H]
MAKTCYFPFLFLTYFFLSSTLLAVARSDDRNVDNESAPEVYQRRDDNTAVVAQQDSLLQNSEPVLTLNEKIELLTTTYASNPPKYVSSMRELFRLYNSNIDITKNGFTNGSISLHMNFNKHTSSEDIGSMNTMFYARTINEDNDNVEIADGSYLIELNVDELLRENKDANGLDNASFGTRIGEDVISGDSTNVCKAIKGSELDATKLFITVNKEGEDKFSVSKLDDFLGECLKAAQDALAQRNASDKKKKKDGNLQSVDPVSGSEASGSQASSSQNRVQKPKKNRKALMDDFKESLVSKDMARCKASAKLLMANSTVSSLMYLFVLIALGICLL